MQYLKRLLFYPLTLLFVNAVLFYSTALKLHPALRVLAIVFLFGLFLYYNINPGRAKGAPGREKILAGGYELILAAGFCLACQLALYIYFWAIARIGIADLMLSINAVVSIVLIVTMLLNGTIRAGATSKQLGAIVRALMFTLWWAPIVNVVIFAAACRTVRAELRFSRKKRLLNEGRKDQAVCATRYPVLMVHGVFFRDWKYFNYWGRIPKELEDNGARVFYGGHNSAQPVEQAGQALASRILAVCEETGCEKVNIIAHSKGGMDCRWAISNLGMDAHVASLTAVSTPHRGTLLAGKLLELTPDKAAAALGRQYAKLFTRLGDDSCDFLGSVTGLTPAVCEALNAAMPDRAGVLYQSAGSVMRAASSAGPPLNAGYAIIKPLGGDNDGLVPADSMRWGECLGILRPAKKKGISHGDMIDLTRKDIPGFDVCEFYVQLAAGLKAKGL